MMYKMNRLFLGLLLLAGLFACEPGAAPTASQEYPARASFLDIPGVTDGEIAAVEKLRQTGRAFVFGVEASAECFYQEDGSIGGFAALFGNWMSGLFDIPFETAIYEWDELLSGLESHTIDFTGDLTPTPARLQVYHMTSPIAARSVKKMWLAGSQSPAEISRLRPPRYIFIDGSVAYDQVAPFLDEPFEVHFVSNNTEAYEAMKTGLVDIFIDESPYEAAFDAYGDIVAEEFFPLIYSSVSLTTRNPELAPIISIVQKALDHGANRHLTELYNQGHQYYLRYKLFSQLTDEEQAYIKAHGESGKAIPIGLEYDNYPVSFYNTEERAWQGISLDVLSGIEKLTGLNFVIAHDGLVDFSDLMGMLEKGEIALLSEVIPTPERQGRFLWPEPYAKDYYALISLMDFKDIEVNEILYLKVGLQKDTAYAETFRQWFPGHPDTVEYNDALTALEGLERREIDLFMGTKGQLLSATNYLEKPGYKVNIIFNRAYESTFGINLNEPQLHSIISKAQRLINTKTINERWTTRVFDYRSAAARARLPYLVGFSLLFGVVVLLVVMFIRSRIFQKRKTKLLMDSYDYVEKMNKALTKIAKSPEFSAGFLNKVADLITQEAYDVLKATRVEILMMNENNRTMHYVSCFEAGGHLETRPDYELTDFPEYEKLLRAERLLTTSDAKMHDILIKSRDDYSQKTSACLDAPVWINGELAGIVSIEQEKNEKYPKTRVWTAEEHNFATSLADFIALTITNAGQRRLEAAEIMLAAEKEMAEQASRSKSDFLATMSHEIRTPMNAIIGISQIQLQKGDLPEEYAAALNRIYNSGNALLGIINDILDMSKIETGKMELNPAEYDVPNLINDAAQLNIVHIGSKQIHFMLEANENLPSKMYGDELRLRQILNNLLSNAIKYTEKGFVKLSADHSAQGEDITLRFIVEDTGQGVKPEDQAKLFSEFSRFNAEANRATEGTGIGLSITKKLIELMDGTIEVESEYGQGSTFTVTVRQKAVECEAIGPEISEKLRNFTFSGDKRYADSHILREPMPYGKVLVVDDKDANLFVAEGLLSPYGLQIETANSGFAAIEKVKNGNIYDVIFMDHMMPLMDGIETTKKLRDMGYEGAIVALTANALVGNDEMFRQNGFDGFIAKPIDTRRLNATLKKFVRDRHPEEAKKYKPEPVAPTDGAAITHQRLLQKSAPGGAVRAELAAGRLDLLNHFRWHFENGLPADQAYYNRFIALVEAMDAPPQLRGEMAALAAAGREGDAETIRRLLPDVYEALAAALREMRNNGLRDTFEATYFADTLRRLKTALDANDEQSIEAAMAALRTMDSLNDEARELYIMLYDALMMGETEKAAEALAARMKIFEQNKD